MAFGFDFASLLVPCFLGGSWVSAMHCNAMVASGSLLRRADMAEGDCDVALPERGEQRVGQARRRSFVLPLGCWAGRLVNGLPSVFWRQHMRRTLDHTPDGSRVVPFG